MEKAYLITHNTNLEKDFSNFDRLYIWDQYCEHNLFYFLDNEIFINRIIVLNKKITITTPIISEKWIIKFFIFLNNFLEKTKNTNMDLEIVVNEQWIFFKLYNEYNNIKIVWGNFLSGQNKDPYLKNFIDKNEHKYISIDSNYYTNLFISKNIDRIELYNVFQWIEMENNIEINLYFPFVIYSINRYCITALINQNKKYLEIVENCIWCKDIEKNDFDMELNIWEKNIKQYFRWNKQFYQNDKLIVYKNVKRIIYNYDLIIENISK